MNLSYAVNASLANFLSNLTYSLDAAKAKPSKNSHNAVELSWLCAENDFCSCWA